MYKVVRLKPFSAPRDEGYYDRPITHDLITDIFLEFSNRTREQESAEYSRSLTGNTWYLGVTRQHLQVWRKAVIVKKNKERAKPMRGGILSLVNEKNEILGWRLCQTNANAEIEEMLEGLKRRCSELTADLSEIIIADNYCYVRGAITKVFPDASVVLDVYHLLARYLAVIINGSKNPLRGAIAKDVVDAVLKTRASGGQCAEYWGKQEQEEQLQAMFEKWTGKGNVWTAAALKLNHVKKGCLVRPRQDIAADGNHIEGSHKGWNSIMRSFASGLEVFTALGHDFVLHRNVRVANSKPWSSGSFLASTHGSHHIRLSNHVNKLWNALVDQEKFPSGLQRRPLLNSASTSEAFGLVPSAFSVTFGGLLEIKSEAEDISDTELLKMESVLDNELEPETVLRHLDIDPLLLLQPLPPLL
ncbi:hypothetical protein A0H81_09132 [Grifola frondosa]|uniref:Transposase IS204/IS1001/IS1096/IS1165 DDE domain-containing protein n=1 Tax=Grifola frondosa TaxID=5627 RepID=A0A1C7M3N2_GRIFR|nr:hypothetical protein A0H81_09132 [Grifola frondosa]